MDNTQIQEQIIKVQGNIIKTQEQIKDILNLLDKMNNDRERIDSLLFNNLKDLTDIFEKHMDLYYHKVK